MTAEDQLSPSRRLWIGAIAVALAATGFVAGRSLLRPNESVGQPVQFNHRVHVTDVGLECLDCHEYYETREHSGLPSLEMCMGCHDGGITDSPEEQKLLEAASANMQETFNKLFMMPDHVYYSHRRHVAVADLPCDSCHGAIADTTAPPETPLMRVSMDTCIDCHEARAVSTDCTHCHR